MYWPVPAADRWWGCDSGRGAADGGARGSGAGTVAGRLRSGRDRRGGHGSTQTGAALLLRKYQLTGDPALLIEAVQVLRAAAAVNDKSTRNVRAAGLGNLAMALHLAFERTGDFAVLEEAVASARRATVEAVAWQRGTAWSNLAMLLRAVFESNGDHDVLDEAVAAARSAAAARFPLWQRGVSLSNLGDVLLLQAERVGDLQAVEEAASAYRAAVACTRRRRRRRAWFRSGLAFFQPGEPTMCSRRSRPSI